ncbi:hypothetical protein BDN67DRAFT_971284 [Paxillus ammoniavirescens]|nr:hypothetical protein BDN67DRAFT_971284 [Paxillus ammoniavirescens]
MFARLTPFILTLLAIASTAAAACQTMCCKTVISVSSTWSQLAVLVHTNDSLWR